MATIATIPTVSPQQQDVECMQSGRDAPVYFSVVFLSYRCVVSLAVLFSFLIPIRVTILWFFSVSVCIYTVFKNVIKIVYLVRKEGEYVSIISCRGKAVLVPSLVNTNQTGYMVFLF